MTKYVASTSIAKDTYVDIGSFTLSAGSWIVIANALFGSSTTGRRCISVSSTSEVDTSTAAYGVYAPANGENTIVQKIVFKEPATSTTHHVFLYQNSGGSLNCSIYVRAIRVK